MKFAIIGGAGFIGSHVCRQLADAGHDIVVLDLPGPRSATSIALPPQARLVSGDLLDSDVLDDTLQDVEIVIYLASSTTPESSNLDPKFDVESNVIGALQVLEAARRQKVRKVIFASSGGTIYGLPQSIPLHEEHSTYPICSYGIAKLTIEKYLGLYHRLHGIDYCILRISNPYGEGQSPFSRQGAIGVFVQKAIKQEVIEVWGDGSVIRDYLHVADVAAAFLSAARYDGTQRIFNIGYGEGHSLIDIIETIQNIIGRPVLRNHLPGRSFDVPISVLDISQARQKLSWRPSISFAEGVSKTIAWQSQLPLTTV